MRIHSLVHSSIGTPSGWSLRTDSLGLLARRRFQGLFHSPHRGAFHRSLAVLVRYRSLQVLSLGEWSPQLPTAFHGRRRTRVPYHPCRRLRVRASHPLRGCFPVSFPSPAGPPGRRPCGNARMVAQPPQRVGHSPHARLRFGLVPVRSPLLGEYISLPRGTKMFQFPRFPPPGL
jgi:hypothetical protein